MSNMREALERMIQQRIFKRMNEDNTDVGAAFEVLKEAIQRDPAYAYSWHANIAMSLYDVMPETFWMPDKKHWHKITNEAATSFMGRAFQVDTSAEMLHDDGNKKPKIDK